MAKLTKKSSYRCPPHPPSPYPWLLTFHGEKMRNQTFYSLSEPENCKVRSVPELSLSLPNKVVWPLSHGWLLLYQGAKFRLWNPVSLDSICLPPFELPHNHCMEDIVLTSPPTNPDSTLVLLVRDPAIIIFCFIRDRTWIARSYENELKMIGKFDYDYDFDYLHKLVVCNNRIYALTFTKATLVQIKIVKKRWLVIRPLRCNVPFGHSLWSCLDFHLVESCGDLFCIDVQRGGCHRTEICAVLVYKLDFSTIAWHKVESCPNRAFFLRNGIAFSCSTANSDRIGGQIYLSMGSRLFSYNIEDKSILMVLPCPRIPTLETSTSMWVTLTTDSHAQNENPCLNEGSDSAKEYIQVKGNGEINQQEEIIYASKDFLSDLPLDILEKIASQLSPFDYINFRAISKDCLSVAPAKQWSESASVELEQHILSPWLIFRGGEGKSVISVVDPRLGVKYKRYLTIPQILEDAVIVYSNNGWLLMYKGHSLMLYNPLTKSVICLPDLPPLGHSFFLSSLPDSSDCIVVGIEVDLREVRITRPGMTEWIYVELIMEEGVFLTPSHLHPIFLNGCFYILDVDGNLGVITIGESDCNLRVHKMTMPCKSFEQNFLVRCGKELLSLFVGVAGEWVQVFKLNQPAMVWEEVKGLGKNSIYVCGVSAISAEAKCSGMENKIYFPRFDGESIICYSLETSRYHSSESKESDSLQNFYGSTEQLSCCWIEPRWYSKESEHCHSLSTMLDSLIN